MRWSLLVALCGCDQVLHLDPVGSPAKPADALVVDTAADAGPPVCDTGAPVLVDDFNDLTPCAPWGRLAMPTNAIVTQGMGALTMVTNADEGRCDSAVTISLPTGGLIVRVPDVPGGQGSYVTMSSVQMQASMNFNSGLLNIALPGAGQPPVTEVGYVPGDMLYWRLVPDPATKTIAGSYSSDGHTWMSLGNSLHVTNAIPATIDLVLKTGSAAGVPVTTKFTYLLGCS